MRVGGKRIEGARERKVGALGSPDRNTLGQANVGRLSPSKGLCFGGVRFAGVTQVRLAVSPT